MPHVAENLMCALYTGQLPKEEGSIVKHSSLVFGALGVVATGVVAGLAQCGVLRKAAVKATVVGLQATDVCSRELQNIVDEAQDVSAEARREARIDACVRQRLAKLEPGIRSEVREQFDKQQDTAN